MSRRLSLLVAPFLLLACETLPTATDEERSSALFEDYRGTPEVVRGAGSGSDQATGTVFVDTNRNGTQNASERGLEGVKVSNGVDVVLTDAEGRYALPKRDDMAVFVIQPAGYQVPHNENWVPQFAYQHKPNGSPKELRFGGMAPTGPLPAAINFPLIKVSETDAFSCAILGDIQAYANQEVGYFRDSTIDDLLDRNEPTDCALAVGDVMGDDLGLIPRMAEVMGTLETPQWWVHGNHDFDFDADYDDDSADSWRSLWGPNYYAFEIGDALFIVLDNVVYPCTAEDAERKGREFCVFDDEKKYNARITPEQMAFVENLLALTPGDKRIVFAHHIPFVSFVDMDAAAHQTDNVNDLYRLVSGRPALSLSGHTHTTENMSPGDSFAGWLEQVDVDSLPFRHIIVGAGSGDWYGGDFDVHGVPMALQRLGAPKGWLDLSFDGADYVETYMGANVGRDRRMWISVNTPAFRSWATQILRWKETPANRRDPVPPLSINDLPDVKIITPTDLRRGTYVTANIWDGSTETTASVSIAGRTIPMVRTQEAQGEEARIGAEWADPFAAQRQLSVARFAYESRSGQDRNQGFEAFRGGSFGPAAPQPQGNVATKNLHLWRAQLPEDLPPGVHAAVVTATDRHGREIRDVIVIEARPSQPPARFRKDAWDAFENGPPVR